MSAFMVDKIHIDHLVQLALKGPASHGRTWQVHGFRYKTALRGYLKVYDGMADEIGEMLTKENLSSIHSRYPDTLETPENTPGPCAQYWLDAYRYAAPRRMVARPGTTARSVEWRLNVAEAFKAIQCYEYQACEHEEWESSDAHAFCGALKEALIPCIPGYEEASWQIEADEGVAR